MKQGIAKQRIFKPLGAFKQMLAQTGLWVSMINFMLIGVTAYNTTLRAHILTVVPGFKLWHFIILLIAAVVALMYLEYKIIYPSWIGFQNEQEYRHQNLLRKDIARLRKELKALKEHMGVPDMGETDEDNTDTT